MTHKTQMKEMQVLGTYLKLNKAMAETTDTSLSSRAQKAQEAK